jgi:phenylpyruvate tautomerase PptA (4-oxalocrotonate tautomerase family)
MQTYCEMAPLRVAHPMTADTVGDTQAKETSCMPSTRITTGLWARGNEAKMIGAVQDALLAALKIPDYDRDVVLDLYDGAGRSDRYTRVEIVLFSGRSLEAKKALYSAVVANLSVLGVPANEIKIILIEVPPENWGLRGGLPASEIDLGFRIDV